MVLLLVSVLIIQYEYMYIYPFSLGQEWSHLLASKYYVNKTSLFAFKQQNPVLLKKWYLKP